MACDALARLYDVDEDTVVFKKLDKTTKYDQGTVTFRARKNRLVDLRKLHESIWATRLSGGTRSGLVSLAVTARGQVVHSRGRTVLRVSGSEAEFELSPHPGDSYRSAFNRLSKIGSGIELSVTGRIADYQGRWPGLLRKRPSEPRRILVARFEPSE